MQNHLFYFALVSLQAVEEGADRSEFYSAKRRRISEI